MLLALKITRGSNAIPRAEIHSTIDVQVQAFIVLIGVAFGFSSKEPITSPFMP
jgi:hypothetical protein